MVAKQIVSGKSVEAKGRTVEQAVEAALARLGRSRNEVEVQVLREASRGLLGFGAQDAIVRVKEKTLPSVRPDSAQPSWSNSPPIVSDQPKEEFGAPAEVVSVLSEPDKPEEDKPQDASSSKQAVSREELQTMSREVLLDILERMHIIADVFATWSEPEDEKDEPTLLLDIIGDDLGLLIGRGGETLRNLQYIVRLIIGRRIGKWMNVVVDVEGYKQRRQDAVRQLARRVANRVIATGRSAHMDPMNSYERRIVHLELSQTEGISTKSSGEGEHRRVGVYPA